MLRDTYQRYGWISICLHWFSAAAIIVLYLTGEELEELARGPARTDALLLHVSIGMIVLVPVLFRMYWRRMSETPERPVQNRVFDLFAIWVPILMLVAVFVAMISGVLVPWSVGNPLVVFDWFSVPSPLPSSRAFHEFLEEVHELASHAILPLLALHILGTLKHMIIDRDSVFSRMLWVRSDD